MKRLFSVVPAIFLAACATGGPIPPQDANTSAYWLYVNTQTSLAQEGKLRWSDYYTGLYEKRREMGSSPEILREVGALMWAAQQFEQGYMPKADFDARQREYTLRIEQAEQSALDDRRQAQAVAESNRAQQWNNVLASAAVLLQASGPQQYNAAPRSRDYSWAWDQQAAGYGTTQWVCRGMQTGQYADQSLCANKIRMDTTWPGY